MRPRINPGWFLLKLVALLVVTYMLWAPLAPYYAVFLLRLSQVAVWLTEFSSDPNWQHTTQMLIKSSVSPTALLFYHTHFTQYASGIPAEWVMANMVLLIPLMLATPVVTWRERFVKLGLALLLAVVLQVFDVVVGIKAYYAANVRGLSVRSRPRCTSSSTPSCRAGTRSSFRSRSGALSISASSSPSGSSPRVRANRRRGPPRRCRAPNAAASAEADSPSTLPVEGAAPSAPVDEGREGSGRERASVFQPKVKSCATHRGRGGGWRNALPAAAAL
jgi:hypothetical protein